MDPSVESLLRGENDRLKERISELEQRVDGYSAMCAEQEELAAKSEADFTAECLAHAATVAEFLHSLKLARECFAPGNRLCRQFDGLIARLEESVRTK